MIKNIIGAALLIFSLLFNGFSQQQIPADGLIKIASGMTNTVDLEHQDASRHLLMKFGEQNLPAIEKIFLQDCLEKKSTGLIFRDTTGGYYDAVLNKKTPTTHDLVIRWKKSMRGMEYIYPYLSDFDDKAPETAFNYDQNKKISFIEDWFFDPTNFKIYKVVKAAGFYSEQEQWDPVTSELKGFVPRQQFYIPMQPGVNALYLNGKNGSSLAGSPKIDICRDKTKLIATKVMYIVDLSGKKHEGQQSNGTWDVGMITDYLFDTLVSRKHEVLACNAHENEKQYKKGILSIDASDSVCFTTTEWTKKGDKFILMGRDEGNEINALLFYEDWYFDDEKYGIIKEVKAVQPIRLENKYHPNTKKIVGIQARFTYIIPLSPDVYPLYFLEKHNY